MEGQAPERVRHTNVMGRDKPLSCKLMFTSRTLSITHGMGLLQGTRTFDLACAAAAAAHIKPEQVCLNLRGQ